MVRPRGESSQGEETDAVRIRRLEDAILALANHVNQTGQQQQQQQHQQPTIFDRFARYRPPTYDGTCDPVLLEDWIREMEKLFTATQCPESQKIDVASYYLQKEADNWWTISRVTNQAAPGFGWTRFCEVLKKRFYPDELRWQKEKEFLQLEQGNLSVQAYADKFMELSRFATTMIPDEASRVRRFEKNLIPKVRSIVAGIPSATFQQAYDRALSVYASVKADEAETERRNPDTSGVLKEKRPFSPQPSYQEAKRPSLSLYRDDYRLVVILLSPRLRCVRGAVSLTIQVRSATVPRWCAINARRRGITFMNALRSRDIRRGVLVLVPVWVPRLGRGALLS
ncbi:hypothetical protein RND81_09G135400 [Saponaria officinalis]|uniref:Retrotransposon gag domain-containing protein n=1 Tax=Saponaria officinalis TaxID=3572 RepID=A0AAW1IK99_SAPOF